MSGALVQNAADRKEVKNAGRAEKRKRDQEIDDLKHLLLDPVFRRFAWRLMAQCAYGETPSRARGDETHQVIGKQDIARWFISEIGEAGGLEPWLLMQREAWQAKVKEEVTADATRTSSAADKTS